MVTRTIYEFQSSSVWLGGRYEKVESTHDLVMAEARQSSLKRHHTGKGTRDAVGDNSRILEYAGSYTVAQSNPVCQSLAWIQQLAIRD
jgi:hypothetical protein